MKERTNTFFGILILVMVIALLSTNFSDSSVSQAYGEAEPTVFAEESESQLPPLPSEELEEEIEPPLPSEELEDLIIKEEKIKQEPVCTPVRRQGLFQRLFRRR